MLKTIRDIKSIAEANETKAKADGNSIVDIGEIINQISPIKRKNQAKIAKSKNLVRL